jgi:hemoglobin
MRLALLLVVALAACGGGGGNGDDDTSTLYARMGGESGVRAFVDDVLRRAHSDQKISAYFRNTSVDMDHIADCMVDQIGAATGGPQTYPSAGCRDMAAAHQGLGVSSHDFDDFAGHVVAAIAATDLSQPDRTELTGVFTATHAAVVEDEGSSATVYQRIGRYPAISAAVGAFETRVGADTRVNAFFEGVTDYTRIHACLSRLLCSLDGPCIYGEEIPEEFPGLSNQAACRTMAASHEGLQDPNANPITITEFNAIAENLSLTLDESGVAPADRDIILGALAPLCPMIIADPTQCP